MPVITDVHKHIEGPTADAVPPNGAAIDEVAARATAGGPPRSSIASPRPSDAPRRTNRVIC